MNKKKKVEEVEKKTAEYVCILMLFRFIFEFV